MVCLEDLGRSIKRLAAFGLPFCPFDDDSVSVIVEATSRYKSNLTIQRAGCGALGFIMVREPPAHRILTAAACVMLVFVALRQQIRMLCFSSRP